MKSMRHFIGLWLCLLVLVGSFATIASAQDDPDPSAEEQTTYTVQSGDNLFRIAIRFNTTVDALSRANGITNTSQITVGQVLIIPGRVAATPVETPTPDEETVEITPEDSEPSGQVYIVRAGDTLAQIAARNNTTVQALMDANNLTSANVILVGQEVIIPGTVTSTEDTEAEPTQGDTSETDAADEQPETTVDLQPSAVTTEFAQGIEVFYSGQDINSLTQMVEQLGIDWVKVRVDWRFLEPEPGMFNFEELDQIVASLEGIDTQILFTVTNAPGWSRSSPDENGPPDELPTFLTFISNLTSRYIGQVDAYQIWDEPNLRRNWNCERRMCDTDYIEMLRLAYTAVNAIDPDAQVITAGLAPTRFNDRINAIDDRLYLETLYSNGVADISDGIAIHPGGWANPPDARCCDQPSGVETHFDNPVFYFLENIESYREIMVNAGDAETSLWITKFGWGTSDDTEPPAEINIFVTYTSLGEQAIYIPRSFELGAELGYIGPMFLDNLNACQGFSSRPESCYNSLLNPSGAPRLAFSAFEQFNTGFSATSSIEEDEEPANPIESVPVEPILPESTEEAPASSG